MHCGPSRDGGIGRRTGLKIRRPQGHGGSTPPPGTSAAPELHDKFVMPRARYSVCILVSGERDARRGNLNRRRFAHQRWIVAVLASLLLVGGCTTPNRAQASAQRYVSVVCGAVEHWKALIEVGTSAFVTEVTTPQVASDYVDQVLRETDTMIAEVEAAGAPALAIGRDVQSKLLRELETIRGAWTQAEAGFKTLAVDHPLAVVGAIERPILSEVSVLRDELRDASGSAELTRAAAADSDCTMLFLLKARDSFGA